MMGGFGMGFMGIFWIAAIVLVAVLVWQYLKKERGHGEARNSPLEILRERYARGEISKKEYDEKKKNLIA